MKENMKRLLSFVIVLTMVLTMLPASTLAVHAGRLQTPVQPMEQTETVSTASVTTSNQLRRNSVSLQDTFFASENPSTALWPQLNTDLSHIICYGQSFSVGADAPIWPDPAVDGVYMFGSITDSSQGNSLSPLATTGNQHPIISAGNVLAQLLAQAGYDTDLILGSYGSGGRTIAQLMSEERQQQIKTEEGYTYDCLSSGRYAVFESSVNSIARYAASNGQSVSCPVIVYLQGETDQNTDAQLGYPENPIRAGYGAGGDKQKYKEYMTRLKEDMQRHVMEAYGQSERPLFMIYQVSGTYTRTQYSSINMAQIEFAQENEDVILVQTPYFAPHYTVSHHLTTNGYRWLGEYIGRYIYTALVEREKPWPILPQSFAIEANNVLRINIAGAQNGLSIDTYTVENATDGNNLYGFNLVVDGKSVVPTNVTISGNDILLTFPEGINLNFATSVYVYYAGKNAKGTGNIRDNSAELGFYEYLDDSNDTGTGNNQGVSHSALDANGNSIIGQKYPLYNWLASFCYEIPVERKQSAFYHWELNGTDLVSVTGASQNDLTLLQGSIENGVLMNIQYQMSETVVLYHDYPWAIEWKASGNGSSFGGGMLLAAADGSGSKAGALYLPADSRGFVAWNVSGEGRNYGIKLADFGIDTRQEHVYRIENRIAADGTNTVYLLVDGVEIGNMNTAYSTSDGSKTEETASWVNGHNIDLSFMGKPTSFLLKNMKLAYLKIWENTCTHSYTATVTEPTCTEDGYTTHICTTCGASYTSDRVPAQGHKYGVGFACGECGYEAKVSVLGDSISTYSGILGVKNAVYPNSTVKSVTDTWWKQVVDALGGEVLKINASGGSRILSDEYFNGTGIRNGNHAAYRDRCVNLHVGNDNPDVILVFMGTNDFSYHVESECEKCQILLACTECTSRTDGNLNVCAVCRKASGVYSSFCNLPLGTADSVDVSRETPSSSCEAYAIMLSKMMAAYPDAQIYCLGLLPRVNPYQNVTYHDHGQPTAFNAELKKVAENAGATFIDLEQCLDNSAATWSTYFGDAVHPTAIGMDKISEAVISGILGNKVYMVSSQIASGVTLSGKSWAIAGDTYEASVAFANNGLQFDVHVSMNGIDITETAFDAQTGKINIVNVSGNIVITIKATAAEDEITWTVGTIHTNDGSDVDSYKNRIRTGFIAIGEGVTVCAANNALVNVVYYDINYKILPAATGNYSDWVEEWNSASAPDTVKYIRVVARDGSDMELTADYGENVTLIYGHIHSYEAVVTAPTCTEGGYTTHTCTTCGASYTSDHTDALGHAEVNDPIVQPTSNKTGLTAGTHCETCGTILTAQEQVPAKGYDWMLEDGAFNILLIGNSFSEDASNCGMPNSQMLDILQSMLGENVKVTVGLCYSGGKGLNWHATQAEQGTTRYSFRVISSENGQWKNMGSYTSADALEWADWDVVSLQHYEINTNTGKESNAYPDQVDPKFDNLKDATEYMLDHVDRYAPDAELYFYMHWARAYKSNLNESLATYQNMAAFFPIVMDYVGPESGQRFETIIPVGLSVQNARTTYLALLAYNTTAYADGTLNLTTDAQIGLQRDGGHLSFNVGRYIAALTFAETILPAELRTQNYDLPNIRVTESVGQLPKEYTKIAQKSVLAAVNSWKNGKLGEVTTIEGYETDPIHSVADEMQVNVPCEMDADVLKSNISAAIRNLLGEDFRIDSMVLPEVVNVGQTIPVTARIWFGYSCKEVQITVTIAEHSYTSVVTAPTYTEQGYTTHTCATCGDSFVDSFTEVRPLNILMIGNSFSWDAADFWYGMQTSMTYDAMKAMLADQYDVHLAVMYQGSATLGYHATCAANNTGTYTFQEIGPETNYTWQPSEGKNANNQILEHLQERDWDIIVIQSYQHEVDGTDPRSTYTGGSAEFEEPSASVGFLLDYFAENEPGAKVYYYMPWSSVKFYGAEGTAAGFEAIGAYTEEQIVHMTGNSSGKKLSGIIPVGTAIENARSTYLHSLNYSSVTGATALLKDPQIGLLYDTQHLSFGVGRYIAGLTVAQSLIPQEMRKTTIAWPSIKESPAVGILPEEYSLIARQAVENAMANPYGITPIAGYDTDPADRVCEAIASADFTGSDLTDEASVRTHLEITIQNLFASWGNSDFTLTIHDYSLTNGTIWNLEAEVTVRIGYTTATAQIFVTEGTSHQFGDWVHVTEPTADALGLDQRVCTECGYVNSREVEGSWQKYNLADHLQALPDGFCSQTNLWSLLEPESVMIDHLGNWVSAGANVHSVTIPVTPGDRIYANSFGLTGSTKGIQVSFIGVYGIIKTTFSGQTYQEFTDNGGYLIVPEGAIAVNVPVWNYQNENELYILDAEHVYSAVITVPTCTESGYTTHICTGCGASYISDYTDALGHNEVTDAAVAPTCTTTGLTEGKHCSACGEVLVAQTVVAALGHSFGEWNTITEATETEEGLKERTCQTCGYVETQVIPTVDHTHDYTAVVTAPTCTEYGYTTYSCTTCGASYISDYVDALGHDYSFHVTLPSGTVKGYTDYLCDACGDAYRIAWLDPRAYEGLTLACIGDSITCGVGVTADQTDYVYLLAQQLGMDYIRLGASGTTLCTDGSRTCNIGKLTEGNLLGADVVTILMGINDFCAAGTGYYELGDIDSSDTSTIYGAVKMWCERIEELRQLESMKDTQFYFVTPVITSWNNSVTSAKNWDQSKTNIHGYTLRDLCNAIIEVCALYDVPVIDLNLISGLYYVSPEDNSIDQFGGDGVHPGATGHEMMAYALMNGLLQNGLQDDHIHNFGSWIITKYPGNKDGEEKRVCMVCSATESRILKSADHNYVSVITAPTCIERGHTTHTCTTCGDSYVDTYTNALGHAEVVDTAVAPTCTATGLTEGKHCDRCGEILASQTEVAALGHDMSAWAQTKAPTCTEKGEEQSACSRCDHVETCEVAALGHNEGIDAAVAPTCTTTGLTEGKHCSACGEVLVAQTVVAALGHSFGEWNTITEATETEEGLKKRTCQTCGYVETQVIPTVDHTHDYNAVVTAPTCTEVGYTTYACRCGDIYIGDETAALGHDMSAWVQAKAPTCTEKGEEQSGCSRCAYVESREVAALGHKEVTDAAVAPTCTATGLTEGKHCDRCSEILVSQTVVEALDHNYISEVTEPTCTQKGYTTHSCQNCGATYVSDETDALGHKYEAEITAPTCTAVGHTTYTCHCGDSYTEEIPATGHQYTHVEGKKDATCGTDGYTGDVVCDDCGAIVERGATVPATGEHTYGDWVVIKEPTTEEAGMKERVCKHCSHAEQEAIAPIAAVIGDVTGDGRVNVRDARMLLRYVAGLTEEMEVDLTAADFNGDGRINVRDARAILLYVVGLD